MAVSTIAFGNSAKNSTSGVDAMHSTLPFNIGVVFRPWFLGGDTQRERRRCGGRRSFLRS